MTNSIVPQFHGPADAAATASILAAVFNVLPTILGIIAGILGVGWYCVLFYDRFFAKGLKADHEEGA